MKHTNQPCVDDHGFYFISLLVFFSGKIGIKSKQKGQKKVFDTFASEINSLHNISKRM